MARVRESIDDTLRAWLLDQHVFFVATAPLDGACHVNLSPKGFAGTFTVLGPYEVAYLDQTGSGIETVAHLRDNGRIVVMFCAFDGPPKIVRLHGRGEVILPDKPEFDALFAAFPVGAPRGLRSIIRVEVERISQSCGFGVPFMTYAGERSDMSTWLSHKTDDEIAAYRFEKNAVSIDGMPGLA